MFFSFKNHIWCTCSKIRDLAIRYIWALEPARRIKNLGSKTVIENQETAITRTSSEKSRSWARPHWDSQWGFFLIENRQLRIPMRPCPRCIDFSWGSWWGLLTYMNGSWQFDEVLDERTHAVFSYEVLVQDRIEIRSIVGNVSEPLNSSHVDILQSDGRRVTGQGQGQVPDEQRLYRDLFSRYERRLRPLLNVSQALVVNFGLSLSQIVDLVTNN